MIAQRRKDAEKIKEGDWVRTPKYKGYTVGRVKILKPPYARVVISNDRNTPEAVFKIKDLEPYR